MKMNKKVFSISLVTVMSLEALAPFAAYANKIDVSVDGLHACGGAVKYKGAAIDGAMCGKRATPEGQVYQYRQFKNPNNNLEIVQQWKNDKGQIRTIVIKKEVEETITKTHQEERSRQVDNDYQRSYSRPADVAQEEDHTARNVMIGVGAVAVVGGGVAAYKIGKSAAKAREIELQEKDYQLSTRDTDVDVSSSGKSKSRSSQIKGFSKKSRPAVLADAPESIKLGTVYGANAGKEAKVAGALRTSDVPKNTPIHTTSSGQNYIVVQNRDTGFLETMLIYDMLTRPYYYHPGYSYYSPYAYGAGGTVVYNNTYVNGDHLYGGSASSSSSSSSNFVNNSSKTTLTQESNSGWKNNNSGGGNADFVVKNDTGFGGGGGSDSGFSIGSNSGFSIGSNSGFSGGNSGGGSFGNSGGGGGGSNWAVVGAVGLGSAAAAGLMSPSDSNAAEMRDRKAKAQVSRSPASEQAAAPALSAGAAK